MSKTRQIKANQKDAKNPTDKIMWADVLWMSKRNSMKGWTIPQLVERWHDTNVTHNTTIEFVG